MRIFTDAMFSGIPQKNRTVAESYFDEHLSHNDYYTQGESQAGHWIGTGAQQLGLKPGEVVTREAFLRLCDNQHPDTGEQLTPQQFRERRIYFDFVCSPPKSVSILAVTMGDKRIIEAHKEASGIALRELEQFAATRIRKGGIQEQDRLPATSSALPSCIPPHALLTRSCTRISSCSMPLGTARRTDGRRCKRAICLAHSTTAPPSIATNWPSVCTGSATKHGRPARPSRLRASRPKFIERFSKRSQQRDMAVKRQEQKLGRKLTKQEVSHVVHQSRPKKLKGASDEQVRKQQLGEIGFFEKRSLRKVVEAADGIAKDFAQHVRHG